MQNFELTKAAFGMLREPVIMVKRELIIYMNPAAVSLSGGDKTGKPVSLILPSHVTNIQADSFVTTAFVGDKSLRINAAKAEGMRVYIMSTTEGEFHGNEMLYAGLKATLTNLKFISSCITNLAESEHNERLMSYIAPLNRSYFKIKHLLDNASTVESLSRGALACFPEQIDLAELCRNMIDTVKLMLGRNGVSFSFNSEKSVYVTGDRALMEQLLLNLLSNSINHISPEGRISVSLLKTGDKTIISVDDDGQGIAPEELSRVFESYRYSNRLEIAANGTGLGLVIVRGIAELHGGTVIVESRGEGRGTAVRVMVSNKPDFKDHFHDELSPFTESSMIRILTELTDCLPTDCYSELYDD